MEKKKILFISQEIFPFLPKTEISSTARRLPQVIQEIEEVRPLFALQELQQIRQAVPFSCASIPAR